jgi:hypothetical protein
MLLILCRGDGGDADDRDQGQQQAVLASVAPSCRVTYLATNFLEAVMYAHEPISSRRKQPAKRGSVRAGRSVLHCTLAMTSSPPLWG